MLLKFFSTGAVLAIVAASAVPAQNQCAVVVDTQLGANYEALKAAMKTAMAKISPMPIPQEDREKKDRWSGAIIQALKPVNEEFSALRTNWGTTIRVNRAVSTPSEWVSGMVRQSLELNNQWYLLGRKLREAQARYPAGLDGPVFSCLATAENHMMAISKLVSALAAEILVVVPGSIRSG